jgi:hypothetical protein
MAQHPENAGSIPAASIPPDEVRLGRSHDDFVRFASTRTVIDRANAGTVPITHSG